MSFRSDNLSVVLHGKEDLRIEVRPISQLRPGEVRISIQRCGICGTDIHFWKSGGLEGYFPDAPLVLGHESSGIVTALGEGVTDFQIGDRVAIEPNMACHKCQDCKEGRYNLCNNLDFWAVPPYEGALCRWKNHRANFCFKIPDNVSFEEAALFEPLSVVIHGCRRAGVTMADKVLVCGAGTIGLLALLAAKASGAAKVCITDISESRLAKAKEIGADYVFNVEGQDSKEAANNIVEKCGYVDKTIECTAVESSIQTGMYVTKKGGTVALIGLGEGFVKIPAMETVAREIDIKGVFAYANCYPAAIAMVASGAINVKPLITHHFNLEDSLQAFETSRTGAGGAIKVIIHCDK